MTTETKFFSKTKKELYLNYNRINDSLKLIFKNPPSIWERSLFTQTSPIKSNLNSIYAINQSIICTLNTVKADLYEGKINNSRLYYESDFQVVDVLVNIYSQFCKAETGAIISDTEILKSKILNQINTLYNLIEHFPEDIATNVKARPRVISKVALDYYQLIYLAFTHTQSQINEMNLVQSLSKITRKDKKVH